MICSDEEKTSDSELTMLVPDLGTLCCLEDINMAPMCGKIIIKGYAVSGCGGGIERLEISMDRCKSWAKCYVSQHKKPASVSFEATVNVSQTIEELKVRAIVINQLSSERQVVFVPDMIRLVLERLNFAEFHKARSISSDWYSTAEESCTRQNQTPWLILFSQLQNHHLDVDKHAVSCNLFDTHHGKTYTVKDLGFGFHKSRCLATCGSWFLMLDHRTNFSLFNLFTRERIRLPTLEDIDGGQMKFEKVGESDFLVTFFSETCGCFTSGKSTKVRIGNAVLWVDERSRDYLVVWNLDSFFAYHRKGDSTNKSWKLFQPYKSQGCVDMAFKESKLYVLTLSRNVTVFDFSVGVHDSPQECDVFPYSDSCKQQYCNNLAVTLSGEVLIVAGRVTSPELCKFDVYRIDPKTSKWSKIHSIGNEALFLDLGTTVAAKDGIMKNCIYFSNDQLHRYNGINLSSETTICVYNIQTNKVYQQFQHLSASSPLPFKDARWFFPTFAAKWLR